MLEDRNRLVYRSQGRHELLSTGYSSDRGRRSDVLRVEAGQVIESAIVDRSEDAGDHEIGLGIHDRAFR